MADFAFRVGGPFREGHDKMTLEHGYTHSQKTKGVHTYTKGGRGYGVIEKGGKVQHVGSFNDRSRDTDYDSGQH